MNADGRFFELLEKKTTEKASYLCAGFDPVNDNPEGIRLDGLHFLQDVRQSVAVVKFNMAFFEVHGPRGLEVLEDLIRDAHHYGLLVILDTKRGDVEHTNRMHAKVVFDHYRADAVTLHPYMGLDALYPFQVKGGCFVLCLTSGVSRAEAQEKYLSVAEKIVSGLVVGTSNCEIHLAKMAKVRSHTDAWLLTPGVGPQGGVLDDTLKALYSSEPRILLSMSRSIMGMGDNRKERVEQLRAEINKALCRTGLEKASAIKRGEFTLKSGAVSDLYCDMRVLASCPALRRLVARSLFSLFRESESYLIAIPTGGLIIGMELSSQFNLPLCYLHDKDHGDAHGFAGKEPDPNGVSVLVDDVITSGGSIRSALSKMDQRPARILCVVNRSEFTEIDGVPITSLLTKKDFQ